MVDRTKTFELAAKSLQDLKIAEIEELDMYIDNGKILTTVIEL